jgi:hypothetical protein
MKKQGHISDHMSLLDIAKKHGVKDSELKSELKKGIKVEQEHTSNVKTAARIALDHLFEDPKYYTKLAKLKLENTILNEYTDKVVNQLVDKFKREDSNLNPDTIKSYIERFSQIKDSPNVSEKDIFKYTWTDLESIIASNPSKRVKAGKMNDGEPKSDANLIYDKNGLRVYVGKDKNSCIKYGNGYSFCISARGTRNMYTNYRFEKSGTPYFIFDDNKTSERTANGNFVDPTHLIVLFTYESKDKPLTYSITTANNPGEIEYSDFKSLEERFPRFKGLEQLFTGAKPDPREKKTYDLQGEYDLDLSHLMQDNFHYINLSDKFPGRFDSIEYANKHIDNILQGKYDLYRFRADIKPSADEDDYMYRLIRQYKYTTPADYKKEYDEFLNTIYSSYGGYYDDHDILGDWAITTKKLDPSDVVPDYKEYLQQVKELVDKYRRELSKAGLMNENSESKAKLNKDLVEEFMKHVTKELKLDSLPKIKFSDDSQEAVKHGSWGGYQTGDKSIRIVTAKRHPADIFRTLAHELVHYKQDITGRLQAGDGKTGSDVENEANSRAAIIMRNFAQAKPSLFEHLITELSYGLENALPFTYIGIKFNEYIFKTDTNEYKVAFKPDGDNIYERVYHTTNRPLGSNFEDTKEGKPLQINATVMKITLDFMEVERPDFDMIYIVPINRQRFNLVSAYLTNNLPSKFSFESHSIEGENIIIIYNSPELPDPEKKQELWNKRN